EGSNSNNDSTNNEEGIKSDEGADSGNINEEEYLDKNKIIVYDILDCDILATQAEQDILEIYRSKFNNYSVMDLRLHSELSLSLDQALQDKILHEVFNEIDKDYITDEIHNFLRLF
ncbi:9968_t:CDS:2, partial [Cetraspora pellucida]